MIQSKVYNPTPHYFESGQCYHCDKDFKEGQIVYKYNGFEFDTVSCLHKYDNQVNCMADQLSREDRLKALTSRKTKRFNQINQSTGYEAV